MIFVYKRSDETYVVFNSEDDCPPYMRPDLIGVSESEIPKGVGELRRDSNGNFYLYNEPDVSPEPEPVPPVETSIEKRLEQIELTSAYTQLQVDYVAFLTEILTTQPNNLIGGN